MILRKEDLSEDPKLVEYREAARVLNDAIDASPRYGEQHYREYLSVTAEVYRYGDDVHLSGRLTGDLVCTCMRCLEDFEKAVTRDFKFLLISGDSDPDLEPDTGLDRFEGDEIDLGALVREQALLALDARALCRDDCKGLCAGCGADLNQEACRC